VQQILFAMFFCDYGFVYSGLGFVLFLAFFFSCFYFFFCQIIFSFFD